MALVVDAANVVGSRPDGSWRDRAGAAARLVAQLRATVAAGHLTGAVVVVLEGAARPGAPVGVEGAVDVRHTPGGGDDALVDVVAELVAAAGLADEAAEAGEAADAAPVVLVTADRGLRARAQAAGAQVVGPGRLLERLDRVSTRR